MQDFDGPKIYTIVMQGFDGPKIHSPLGIRSSNI